jgi:transcriptional regulator of nitric oxide reductase
MQMLYNSDSFAVVLFDVPSATAESGEAVADAAPATPGGYEIVDKSARRGIFIQGALAESFKQGVDALIETQPSEEEVDAFIERYTPLMQQPVVLH